jgi:hypothetical protein|tara:strand:+ start:2808 stop:4697 length:1890 start_codon:yes stop_codon:yes gene_type:complete
MFGFSFLVPAFLSGCLAAAVPIVLHLMRRERLPRVKFSAIRFLQGAPVEQTRRRRLRELLLLALRVAALLLLAFAFARPFFNDAAAPDRAATVVLVDTSFSMSAPGQAERVRAQALEAIATAPEGHLVGVVAFDDTARVVADLASSRARARAAVDGLASGIHGTRYREGLAAASRLIGARDGRIVVVTDLQASGWEQGEGAISPQIDVEISDVAPPAGNLAVVSIEPESGATAVVLFQAGASAGEIQVALAVDGDLLSEVKVTPEPGRSTVRFPEVLPATGVATVSLGDPLGYPVDDHRYRLLDPQPPVPVLVITTDVRAEGPVLYLERALAAGEDAGSFRVARVAAEDVALRTEPLERARAVVLIGARGLDGRGRDRLATFVRGGGGLLLVAGPTLEPALVTDLFDVYDGPQLGLGMTVIHDEPVTLTPTDLRHPIIAGFGSLVGTLGRARFTRTIAMTVVEPDTADAGLVIARFDDGSPALVEHAVGEGRVLVFASDLGNVWNDFPRRPAFVPFLHETVGYLTSHRAQPREFVVGTAPPGTPDALGAFTLADGSGRAVLNVDPRESDPTSLAAEQFEASVNRLALAAEQEAREGVGEREAGQRLWRYALMLMALVLVAEGLLGRRAA